MDELRFQSRNLINPAVVQGCSEPFLEKVSPYLDTLLQEII